MIILIERIKTFKNNFYGQWKKHYDGSKYNQSKTREELNDYELYLK